jgi:hypothetical protein
MLFRAGISEWKRRKSKEINLKTREKAQQLIVSSLLCSNQTRDLPALWVNVGTARSVPIEINRNVQQ